MSRALKMIFSTILNYWLSWKLLWRNISLNHKKKLIKLLILMLVASLFEALSIGLVAPFLTVLLNPNALMQAGYAEQILAFFHLKSIGDVQAFITAVFSLAILIAGVTRLLLIWYTTLVVFSVGASLSSMVYESALYQPYSYHLKISSSNIISTASTKTSSVIFNTVLPLINLLNSVFMLIAILVTLSIINAQITGIIFLSLCVIYTLITYILRARVIKNGHQISVAQNNIVRYLQEGLKGIKHILIDGNQQYFIDLYSKADFTLRRSQGNNQLIAQSPKVMIETLGILGIAMAGYAYSSSDSAGMLGFIPLAGVLVLSSQRLLPAMQQAYSAFSAIQGGYPSLVDVLSMLGPVGEKIKSKSSPQEKINFNNQIEIRDLSFKYEQDSDYIFKKLNLSIKKGECVGIIGRTGVGKSTLIDLIAGLLKPNTGSIAIDGILVNESNLVSWRSKIAYVPQTIFLSEGTVAENIALGIPLEKINVDRVKWAAQQARIDDFIETLPKKYNSYIGESGVQISGGQRQRLALARALYKSASIIILDEATSALDIQTEDEIMNSISSIKKQVTLFIISHRLSSLNACDKIIKLEPGVVSINQAV